MVFTTVLVFSVSCAERPGKKKDDKEAKTEKKPGKAKAKAAAAREQVKDAPEPEPEGVPDEPE